MVLHVSDLENSEKHPCIEKLGDIVNKSNNPGIDAILEVTYGYKNIGNGKRYNTSLFEEYCGVKYYGPDEREELLDYDSMPGSTLDQGINLFLSPEEGVMDYKEIKNIFISKASGDIDKFKELSNEIEQTRSEELSEYGIGENEKKILLETIDHNICLLQLAINGIDFELEKAGYKHGLSEDEISSKIQENERLEKIVFGGNILDNKKESEFAFQYLMRGFKEYSDMTLEQKQKRVDEKMAQRVLDSDESDRLEGYIGRIAAAIREKGHSTEFIKPKEHTNPTRDFFKKYSHVRIPRDVVKNFFQGTIDLQGMRQSVEVTSKGSIYDGPSVLEIPNSEAFETLDFERVCGLLVHEISGHYVNQANHEAGAYGNARTSGNIEKEEGLAMLSEKLVKGLPVSGPDVMNPSFIMVLASEIFSGEELKDFIDLYMDISERKSSPDANLARRKRNYPDNHVGVQHKDVAYVRGLIRVTEYLDVGNEDTGGDVENLFVGKVGIDSIINGDFQFDEQKMLFPILNVEVMLFYIMNALQENKKLSHSDFVKYMRLKYKGIISQDSFKRLEDTKLDRKTFKAMLGTISPIINEFSQQQTANSNEKPSDNVTRIAQRVSDILADEKQAA